MLLALAIISAR